MKLNNLEDINTYIENNAIKDYNLVNIDNYITFIKSKLKLNDSEIRYIIELTLDKDNIKLLYKDKINEKDYIQLFMSKYLNNYNILKEYIKINKLNFNNLIFKLNTLKNKAHFYFEDINKNLPYYISIIDYLENTSNMLL